MARAHAHIRAGASALSSTHQSSSTKRSPNNKPFPLGNVASRYDTHLPSENSGKDEDSPTTPKENAASPNGIVHSPFCPRLLTISKTMMESFGETRWITAGD